MQVNNHIYCASDNVPEANETIVKDLQYQFNKHILCILLQEEQKDVFQLAEYIENMDDNGNRILIID